MPKKKKFIKKRLQKNVAPKECWFCKEKKEPTYADMPNLQRFLTERGKIIPRSRNGLCGKHQKEVTKEIKHARHLALVAFIAKV